MKCECCVYFDKGDHFCYYYKEYPVELDDCTGYTGNCETCCKKEESQ